MTPEQQGNYRAAIAEIDAVCRRYGILLLGGCEQEGVLGEITISPASNPNSDWSGGADHADGVLRETHDGIAYVYGIGGPKP